MIEGDILPVFEHAVPVEGRTLPETLRHRLFGRRNGIIITLHLDEKPWGLLLLDDARALDAPARAFYRSLAVYAELALANARSFEQQRRMAQERAILAEAARSIMTFRETDALGEAMSRLAGSLVRAQSACVLHWRGDAYVPGAAFGDDPIAALARGAFDMHTPIHVPAGDSAEYVRRQRAAADRGNPRTALFALSPNVEETDQHFIASLLAVTRAATDAPFSSNDLRLLQELSALLALAMHNLELYGHTETMNRALSESNTFKDDLLAMFAHDFNGPLTVILGYCELLLETAPAVRTEVDTIFSQAQRLARLSQDAIALAQTQSAGFSLAREVVDFGAFVEQAACVHNAGSVRVKCERPAEALYVSLDPMRFRHLLDNLIGNALKYSQDEVRVCVRRQGTDASVEVTDTGIGIPADELPQMFSRFGRATNARGMGIAGSGVGLYVSRQIAQVHGGTIFARSRVNEGSTFTVTIPLQPSS